MGVFLFTRNTFYSITVENGVALSPKGNICLAYIRQYRCFKKHPHNIFCQQTGIQHAIEV